jgi:hypothetical protein
VKEAAAEEEAVVVQALTPAEALDEAAAVVVVVEAAVFDLAPLPLPFVAPCPDGIQDISLHDIEGASSSFLADPSFHVAYNEVAC